MSNAKLLIHCADEPGLVAAVSTWIGRHGGNIEHFEQHVDAETETFFMRAEWSLSAFDIPRDEIRDRFEIEVGAARRMHSRVFVDETPLRVALFASRLSHCLSDVLARVESGELPVVVPLVVSNHDVLRPLVERHGVRFERVAVDRNSRAEAEERQRALLAEAEVDLVVLARYMQILSSSFAAEWAERMINIHHSFLPAFPGAKPYHQAHERGVKIIGATSHYVTADLDEGPIIAQAVAAVSHRDGVEDLVRKGRDIEKVVLSNAIRAHVERRVLVHHGRTVVFGE